MRKIVFIALFLIACYTASTQQGRQYSFTHYNTTNGSVSNQVNSIVQDDEGYLWTATTDGLQRYDGIRYKVFRHSQKDPTSLPSNPVWQLMVDRKKNLWVMLASGKVGIFDRRTFRFQEMKLNLADPTRLGAMKKLMMDAAGNVIMLIRGYNFYTWSEKTKEFALENNLFNLPDGMQVFELEQQPGTRKFWLNTAPYGLTIYNDSTGQLNYEGHNRDNEPAIDAFKDIKNSGHFLFDRKGRVWFDTWGPGFPYVHAYDLKKNYFPVRNYGFLDEIKSYYEVSGFFLQSDGSVWVEGLGLFAVFLEKENKFQRVFNGYLNGRSISYDAVHDLYEDREKNIWVATRNNGMYRFNPSTELFTNVSHINRNINSIGSGSAMSFAVNRDGHLVVGTWGDGIYEYTKDLNLLPTSINGIDKKLGPSTWDICISRDRNTMYLAAQPGIYFVNQLTHNSTFFNPPQLQNRTVRQIDEDLQGNLWVGLQSIGLYKWTRNSSGQFVAENLKFFEKLPMVQVNRIMVDRLGLVWIGTAAHGVFVIDPAKNDSVVMRFTQPQQTNGNAAAIDRNAGELAENAVSSILEYDDNQVVITTSTTIHIYDRKTGKMRSHNPPESLSGFIASMEKDDAGYIWVSTTSGLYRVNMKQKVFIRFTRDDGIDDDNFTLGASAHLPDGRLIFGSSTQFIIFDPMQLNMDDPDPGIQITDFRVMNQSLRIDSLLAQDPIRLGPNSNSLAIEFSSMSYSYLYLIKYKLEGLDKEWKLADANNQAIYSYLPPGNYTLLIQGINAEGKKGKITSIRIHVTPPFWKSWWFFSILALITGILFFWFDRERQRRNQAMYKMRSDISDNLHGEINTALNNINILSEMARLKSTRDPGKAEEYIEQIHTKSHNMIIAMDDMLWSLDARNDSMQKTVERMREYIDALNSRHGTYIDMLVDKNVEHLKLNMKLRHEAFVMFKDGIYNLVQTGVNICHIHLTFEKPKLIYTMQFENEHCDMQKLHNLFHRQDMEKRIEAIHAEIDVQVHKNSSLFVLKIPVE